MSFISPKDLYADPKLWLSVPHEFHESLSKLMSLMFTDWDECLEKVGCHCLACEGKEPTEIIVKKTGEKRLLTGWVEKPELLLSTR